MIGTGGNFPVHPLAAESAVINAGLAGLLCTTAMVFLLIEFVKNPRREGLLFCLLYGAGTAFWTVTGLLTNSYILLLISTIQTACALGSALYALLQKRKTA